MYYLNNSILKNKHNIYLIYTTSDKIYETPFKHFDITY